MSFVYTIGVCNKMVLTWLDLTLQYNWTFIARFNKTILEWERVMQLCYSNTRSRSAMRINGSLIYIEQQMYIDELKLEDCSIL